MIGEDNTAIENVCVLCKQNKKAETCIAATDAGYVTFMESANNRKCKIDHKYGLFLDDYLNMHREDLRYHRKCYSDFTNKTMISRLKSSVPELAREPDLDDLSNHAILSTLNQLTPSGTPSTGPSNSACVSTATDWSLCVVCQKEKPNSKDHLRQVSTDTATKIENFAEIDNVLFHRIKDINLVHAKVQHHGLCLIDLERRYKQKTCAAQKKQSAFNGLCVELRIQSANQKVLTAS